MDNGRRLCERKREIESEMSILRGRTVLRHLGSGQLPH